MVWVIIHRTKSKQKNRVRLDDGKITPTFEYPQQAYNYISKYLGNQGYFDITQVGK